MGQHVTWIYMRMQVSAIDARMYKAATECDPGQDVSEDVLVKCGLHANKEVSPLAAQ